MQRRPSCRRRANAPLLLTVLVFSFLLNGPAQPSPFESPSVPTPANKIDELVFAKLQELNLKPAKVCSDPVFVRRVYLDTIGTLPTAAESQGFIRDRNPNKRAALIDRLLASEEFADSWAMKWSDLLRIKAEFPINLWPEAAQGYHHWIRECLRTNMPYDQFARSMLTASGSDFGVPPVNFYRALQSKDPQTIARTVALTFMGTRMENWPAQQQSNLEAFFSNVGYKATREWKEEIVFYNPDSTNAEAAGNAPRKATFPDGSTVELLPDKDPRVVFTDWLESPRNPWFARNIVNRVWSWLLGRGIIQAPDDIRPDNPPGNPELLAYLERELVSSGYDLKHIYRLILNSETYQLSSIPNTDSAQAAAHFAFYPLRRLGAEVLIDAVDQITGSTESYSSAIPEPWTYIPPDVRSIALPDGSITSAFLELFGRPPRDTGLESERNNRITAAQKLWLLNSSAMRQKIERSRMIQYQTTPGKTPREIANGMYLGILSRFPTEAEAQTVENYFKSSKLGRREATVDVAWALMNSDEFLYQH
jgi:Protein of unknown function (DUF1553)/Protein of unknown function (DUF1549)